MSKKKFEHRTFDRMAQERRPLSRRLLSGRTPERALKKAVVAPEVSNSKNNSGSGLGRGADGALRCAWCLASPEYVAYHDEEWGFPSADDRRLFEKLCLEGFQAGLSWLTILRKRAAFRRAFAEFDPLRMSRFGPEEVERLVADPAIVRHRGKIEAVIQNASRALELREEVGSLAAHIWRFEPSPNARPQRVTQAVLRALTSTPESVALSKDLLRRGWRFVGPTTMYAFMQAMGLVNDHLEGCFVRPRVEDARRKFRRP